MKTSIFSFLFFWVCVSSNLFAQIVLTADEVVDIGDTVFTGMDTVLYAPGPSGSNVSWDFSELKAIEVEVLAFLNPEGTPKDSVFTESNLVAKNENDEFFYVEKTSTSINIHGFYGDCDGTPCTVKFDEPDLFIKFPLGIQDSFEFSNKNLVFASSDSPLPGTDSIKLYRKTHKIVTADANGNVTTPLGTFDALRVKEFLIETDSSVVRLGGVWSNFMVEHDTSFIYSWWAGKKHLAWPLVEISLRYGDEEGSAQWLMQFTSEPSFVRNLTNQFSSVQIFPNPATDLMQIRIKDDLLSETYLVRVFDLQGREVLSDKLHANFTRLNISQLLSGIYFLSIEDASNGERKYVSSLIKH